MIVSAKLSKLIERIKSEYLKQEILYRLSDEYITDAEARQDYPEYYKTDVIILLLKEMELELDLDGCPLCQATMEAMKIKRDTDNFRKLPFSKDQYRPIYLIYEIKMAKDFLNAKEELSLLIKQVDNLRYYY